MTVLKYDAPEFYPRDRIVVRVEGPLGLFLVVSEGERAAFYNTGGEISNHAHFRREFPDGVLPEDDSNYIWKNNGWFAVYEERSSEALDEPMFSLAEAVDYALSLAYGE